MTTPRSLAEKIVEWLPSDCKHVPDGKCLDCQTTGLESLLAEAFAERIDRDDAKDEMEMRIAEARAAAYEECAKIADGMFMYSNFGRKVAAQIRRRAWRR